ncbi:MAG TPA: ATP-binding protein, partial [Spirochaetota bacterium]|nr:ATP-binding protein [Spirochaetota bacterium]
MKFVNRENELKALNDEYKKDSSFVVLYGRRRAGKTTLIKEFIADKRALYFFSDTQAEVYQISRFKSQMA